MKELLLAALAVFGIDMKIHPQMTFTPAGPYPVEAGQMVQYAAPRWDTLTICRPVVAATDPWKARPAILLIHGGGWGGGSTSIGRGEYTGYSPSWCRMAASWGFVAFSVGYRLRNRTPENDWPAALVDVQAAVRYVRANAERLGVDCNMVVAWGDSAGGSLALQLGALGQPIPGDLKADNAGMKTQVEAVIDAFGPVTWGPSNAAGPLPATAIEAATATGSTVQTAETLIIQGNRDSRVPPSQPIGLYCQLKAAGRPVHFLGYPGGHEYSGIPVATWNATVAPLQIQAISFLFAYGHATSSGATSSGATSSGATSSGAGPVIPLAAQGPGLPFDDDVPSC